MAVKTDCFRAGGKLLISFVILLLLSHEAAGGLGDTCSDATQCGSGLHCQAKDGKDKNIKICKSPLGGQCSSKDHCVTPNTCQRECPCCSGQTCVDPPPVPTCRDAGLYAFAGWVIAMVVTGIVCFLTLEYCAADRAEVAS